MLSQLNAIRSAATLAILLCYLTLLGCSHDREVSSEKSLATTEQPPDSSAQLRAEIDQFLADFVGAYKSGSVDSLEPFYFSDSLIWADKREAFRGWPAIRGFLAGGFDRYSIDARAHLLELRLFGNDTAFIKILADLTLTPKDGGPPINRYFRDFVLLQRVDGTWRVARDIDQPVTPEIYESDLKAFKPQ